MDREERTGAAGEAERIKEPAGKKAARPPRAVAWREPSAAARETEKPAAERDAWEAGKPAAERSAREAEKPAAERSAREAEKPAAERSAREAESLLTGENARGEDARDAVSADEEASWRGQGIFRPSDGLLAAFFIPVIILVVIFAQRGIFPFGEETFLRTDMYHQYAPFFSEFRYKLQEGGSLLYSWDVGMGVNFAALYAYYLASPLNWLVFFCPESLVIEFMTYLIIVKTGLCGLSFAYYLGKHNRLESAGVAFFGIFYALSGYMAAYSWNIMWLDCILLFPLIVLGLERLVQEKRGLGYCVFLGLSILSNYYISIMICLFMVLYFVCLLILEKRNRRPADYLSACLRFAFYSLLAGALAAAVLLPEIAALQSTASGDFNFPETAEQYFPIFDMLARHIGNVETEIGLDHWPNLYCGVAVFLFLPLYFACRRIPAREKAVYGGLLLFFYASFSINVLNFIWHGFHYPNSLPCRQSFIYIFLVLSMCFRAFVFLDGTPKRRIGAAFGGAAIFLLLAQKLITDDAYHFIVFYVAFLFLAIYTGILYFYKNARRPAFVAALLAMGVVSVEAAANTAVTSVTTTSRTAYTQDNADTRTVTRDLRENGGFYRIDKTDARTKNDGAWMNFPSASLFSSVANADMTELFRTLGCEASTNAYSIVGSTPLTDSLFSIRYALYHGKQENPRLSLYSFSGETYLYENPWTLPLGFILPDIAETGWKLDLQTPIDVQNDLSYVLDVPESFELIPGHHEGGSFTFTVPQDGEYYICIMNRQVQSVSLSSDREEWSRNIDNVNRGFLIETGYRRAGEVLTVQNGDGQTDLNARAYRFQEEGLQGIYERLNRNPLRLSEWEDTRLAGTIDAGDGGTLFLSIPYDEGWTALVDGKAAVTRKIWGAFTGFEVPAGTHQIELSYEPPGLREGTAVSAAALAILFAAFAAGRLRRRRGAAARPEERKRPDEEGTC